LNTPHLYYVPELVKWANTTQTCHPEAGWIPARPLGFQGLSLKRRLKLAWGVFTGKYDAMYWEPTLLDLYPREDNTGLNKLLGQAIDATKGVNIFTEPALTSATNAQTSATPAMKFTEMPPVWDQGDLNAGAACALTAAMAATGLEGPGIVPFMYYNQKHIDEHERTS
jgi:hypothetical protein